MRIRKSEERPLTQRAARSVVVVYRGTPALLFLGMLMSLCAEEMTWEYSVQVSARVQTNPPAILFSWPGDAAIPPDFYTVSRKAPHETAWGNPVRLPGTATNYVDTNVVPAVAYEYQFFKSNAIYVGYGYITAGMLLPLVEDRGKVILLVERNCAAALAPELLRLEQDLVGDGWTVLRREVARDAPVPEVKALIKAEYEADPQNVKALFLLGRVPVPYSGDTAPDGHFLTHAGAWPSDTFYGDMDGIWTDTNVNVVSSYFESNFNVPGDGKYDQAEIPGEVKLQIGRVDLSNMPGMETNRVPTFPPEIELYRRYLNKDHNYRHRKIAPVHRGIIYNQTGDRAGEAFAANAWRNWAPLLGPPSARSVQAGEFLPMLSTNSYLWAYATSGAAPAEMGGLGGTHSLYYWQAGTTLDFAEMDPQACFVMMLGSSIGDWDLEDNLMRSVLATPTYGLAAVYAGRPHWFFHPMGLGETLGYCARLTQNNHAQGLYRNHSNNFAGFAHIALLGDPTLRHDVVAPPAQLTAVAHKDGVRLNWSPSKETVAGYHVYRRPASDTGRFVRVTDDLLSDSAFFDNTPNPGDWTYMVRTVVLEETPSGSYYNASQGSFVQAHAGVFLSIHRSRTNANMSLSWKAAPGKVYKLLTSEQPGSTNWVALDPPILATAGLVNCFVNGGEVFSGQGWSATNSTRKWMDDDLPGGAMRVEGPWTWVSNNPAPFSGQLALESTLAANFHQQYFTNAVPLSIQPGDVLFAHVYLDPSSPPAAIMLQWNDGTSWEHRVFWGQNLFHYGELGTAGRLSKGALPPTGQWVTLEVPAEEVGLVGANVSGMAFSLYNGRAVWDQVGKRGADTANIIAPQFQRFFKLIQVP